MNDVDDNDEAVIVELLLFHTELKLHVNSNSTYWKVALPNTAYSVLGGLHEA